MTTQVYELNFKDGKQCTEPATDEENIESIRRHMQGIIESVTPVIPKQKEAR